MKKKTEKLLLGESAIGFVLFTGINTSLIPFQREEIGTTSHIHRWFTSYQN